jgi:hypothetical protein
MVHPQLRTLATFLRWYASSGAALLVVIVVLLLLNDFGPARIFELLPRIALVLAQHPLTWIVLALPYLLAIVMRSLVRAYRSGGFRGLLRVAGVRILFPVSLLALTFLGLRWYTADRSPPYDWKTSVENLGGTTRNLYAHDGKHRGMNFVAYKEVTKKELAPLLANNIEWIVLVPFGWQKDEQSPDVRMSTHNDHYWSETDSGIVQISSIAHSHGMRVMLKPHLWLLNHGQGTWLSDISMESEEAWHQWFDSYRKFILHYAELAQRIDAEAFCIGTELHRAAVERPEDWREIISDVKHLFSGKITYAANWDREVYAITFWDDLDFIGVQGYFPLSKRSDPPLSEVTQSWETHAQSLESLSSHYKRPILFTEIGYRSTADGAIRPWEWPEFLSGMVQRASSETQAHCYESFFSVLWSKDWFAGAHIWKWYADHSGAGGPDNIDFTPQNKPAQNILAQWYARPGEPVNNFSPQPDTSDDQNGKPAPLPMGKQ